MLSITSGICDVREADLHRVCAVDDIPTQENFNKSMVSSDS